MPTTSRPIAIYHEHPDWFRPLFAELDRRGTPYVRLDARRHHYDVAERERDYSLVFNRMSPSAYLRGDVPWHLLHAGLPRAPRAARRAGRQRLARVPGRDLEGAAARAARVARPAVPAGAGHQPPGRGAGGGGGAAVSRWWSRRTSAAAARASCATTRRRSSRRRRSAGTIDLGIDSTALVQEFVPARGGHITRVETLGGKYLYAIKRLQPGGRLQPLPGRRLPDHRRRRARRRGVRRRRREAGDAGRGVHAAARGDRGRRADRRGGRDRRRRHRVHDRRPRRRARFTTTSTRCPTSSPTRRGVRRLRSVRAAGRLSRKRRPCA